MGAATIALRGFDARATLILLDGRRVAVYPTGNNPGLVNTMFVDLNSIPQAAIQSIEILKDGASTTYGADAVAGVVNLKMRHDYNGAEARIQYGNTLDKDSGELDAYGHLRCWQRRYQYYRRLELLSSQLHLQPRSRFLAHSAVPKLE